MLLSAASRSSFIPSRACLLSKMAAKARMLQSGRLELRIYASAKLEKFALPSPSDPVTVAILGDLHIGNPVDEPLFNEAIRQINELHANDELRRTRIVQLGDLGSSKIGPGSRACFQAAHALFGRFDPPYLNITGNHDLEGAEFDSDEANLQAWRDEFGQHHYWAVEVGPAVLIGLSTSQFRNAEHSVRPSFLSLRCFLSHTR